MIFLIIGIAISIPFNHWYTANTESGEEGLSRLFFLSVVVYWPLLAIVGGWFGNRRYKRKAGK